MIWRFYLVAALFLLGLLICGISFLLWALQLLAEELGAEVESSQKFWMAIGVIVGMVVMETSVLLQKRWKLLFYSKRE